MSIYILSLSLIFLCFNYHHVIIGFDFIEVLERGCFIFDQNMTYVGIIIIDDSNYLNRDIIKLLNSSYIMGFGILDGNNGSSSLEKKNLRIMSKEILRA